MLEGNGQPMTNDRLTTATTTALAACSPQAAAADLINQYVSSLGTFDPESIFDDDAFEAAILNRNDQYLDLLLSGGVRSEKHARLLWNRAVGAIESGDISYGESVKENLISAQGSYLINGDRYALGKNLTEIGREVFPSTGEITKLARVALRSEYNRALIARIVSKKFPIIESIEEPLLCIFWDEVASNKCINLDRTNSESPDLDAWAIKDGITHILNTAPATADWYYTLEKLIGNLDFSIHYLPDLDTDLFIKKWANAKLFFGDRTGFDWVNEGRDEESQLRGNYLNIPAGLELAATVLAKAGKNFTNQKSFKDFREAEKSDDLLSKAVFYGKKIWITDELLDAIENNELSRESQYFLLLNRSLYENQYASARAIKVLSQECEYWREGKWLLKRQRQMYFDEAKLGILGGAELTKELTPVIDSIDKLKSDHERLYQSMGRLVDNLKSVRNWAIFLIGLWLLSKIA